MWAKDYSGASFTLRQLSVYAETALGMAGAKQQNLVGQLYQHYDEAGLNQIESCDFKGNPLEKIKQVISDAVLLNAGMNSYTVDWSNAPNILDATQYRTTVAYDALNRGIQLIYPEDVAQKRKVVLPVFNKAGALEGISMLDDIGGTLKNYVKHIAYNARGQRLLIAYGNNTMTRYTYHPNTFHLLRQRTETFTESNFIFTSNGSVKQDTQYEYDLVGNIIGTHENLTGCGIGGTNALQRDFQYDALYRLIMANGRENAPTQTPFWNDGFRSNDNATTSLYTQRFSYDKVGNITKLQHIGNSNFTRNFNYASGSNRLQRMDVGQTNYDYSYDANGNQLTETNSRIAEWDALNRMKSFRIESSGTITQFTHYRYDAAGMRVKKLTVDSNNNFLSTVYVDGVLEYTTDGTDEQNILFFADGADKMLELRIGAAFGDTKPATKYYIADVLGSCVLQLDGNGALIDREEYYAFGETSFSGYARKRYRYCGKEKDEESGYYFYGARYYAPWLCRFTGVDPLAGKSVGQTPYHYCSNNPVNRVDPSGMTDGDAKGGGDKTETNTKTNQVGPLSNSNLKINFEPKIQINQIDNVRIAPEAQNLERNPSMTIDVYQGKNSEGETVEFNSYTTFNDSYNTNGILVVLHDIDNNNKIIGQHFQQDAVAIADKPDDRDMSQKVGDLAGKVVEKTIKPPVEKIDNYMKSASQVGVNIEVKGDFNKYSVGGKLGVFSTSETNVGAEASVNYTIKANIKKTKEDGWSSTLSNFKFKPSLKINFYASHGDANKDRTYWNVSNSTIVEGKVSAGPFEISADSKKVDQISIGLLKTKQDFGAELGVKNQTKWFIYTGITQIGN